MRPTAAAKKQEDYNTANGIVPVSIVKTVRDITERLRAGGTCCGRRRRAFIQPIVNREAVVCQIRTEQRLITEMEKQMKQAAKDLEFEKAAALRESKKTICRPCKR
jgi:excinuclease ABC subunit B